MDWKKIVEMEIEQDGNTTRHSAMLTLPLSLHYFVKAQRRGWLNEVVRTAIRAEMIKDGDYIKALKEYKKKGGK